METARYLEQLTRNSELLASAASAAGVAAAVPTCPGWTVADLLDHLVRGDDWAKRIVQRGKQGITERTLPDPPAGQPEGEALVPFFREGALSLVAALADVDGSTPVWTFSAADRTASFWQRRRAQETAIHRYDAEVAAGTPTAIDAALAADGIDEFVNVFLPRFKSKLDAIGDVVVRLRCTDIEGQWNVASRAGPNETPSVYADQLELCGTASNLLLFLWGRLPTDAVNVVGEGDLLDRFRAAIAV